QDIKSCIISTMIDKNSFSNIDITKVDKLICLKECMQARINIDSNLDFKSIIPIRNVDHLNKSFIDSQSINLSEVDPYELEDLVCTLFRNMGYEVKNPKKSHDGGIDCELYNSDPILGGKVIGQVKRYKKNIDIPKLREFESVLRNSDAMKGIFISTSNFSLQCKVFAQNNNITLINGDELVGYFNDYGISSYIGH
ncbi:MAG: restriction endonuclease, partial [Peptostreptococcaceae bacterium]